MCIGKRGKEVHEGQNKRSADKQHFRSKCQDQENYIFGFKVKFNTKGALKS